MLTSHALDQTGAQALYALHLFDVFSKLNRGLSPAILPDWPHQFRLNVSENIWCEDHKITTTETVNARYHLWLLENEHMFRWYGSQSLRSPSWSSTKVFKLHQKGSDGKVHGNFGRVGWILSTKKGYTTTFFTLQVPKEGDIL